MGKVTRGRIHKNNTRVILCIQRLGIYEKVPSKKKENEPHEWTTGKYPRDKVQIDVKYVPKKCMSKKLQEREEKYYQYTAIDEYTRIRYMVYKCT